MKKLFLFAVAAGMFFVACNGGSTEATSTDSAAVTPAVDTVAAAPVDSSAIAPVDSSAVAPEAAEEAKH